MTGYSKTDTAKDHDNYLNGTFIGKRVMLKMLAFVLISFMAVPFLTFISIDLNNLNIDPELAGAKMAPVILKFVFASIIVGIITIIRRKNITWFSYFVGYFFIGILLIISSVPH
jgi:hypothetical protein